MPEPDTYFHIRPCTEHHNHLAHMELWKDTNMLGLWFLTSEQVERLHYELDHEIFRKDRNEGT